MEDESDRLHFGDEVDLVPGKQAIKTAEGHGQGHAAPTEDPRSKRHHPNILPLLELPAVRQARDADLARPADDAEVEPLLKVIVVAVLRVDDPDVHVVRPGQEVERAHAEARHALAAPRDRRTVDERVRPVDAGAVVAVHVEAEDRVADVGVVAVMELERGRLAGLEDRLLAAIRAHDAGADDLDLLAAVARTDLAARGALALLAFANFEVVFRDDVAHRAGRADVPLVEPDRTLAEPGNSAEVGRHEADRLLVRAELGDLEERGDAAAGLERPRGGLRRARNELEERRLPGAVRADHAERVALADLEAHVVERLDLLGRRVLAQRPFLERAALLAVQRV